MKMKFNVMVGTEPQQHIAGKVLESSIRRTTKEDINFIFSWDKENGWIAEMKLYPSLGHGTDFSTFRWLVPKVARRLGLTGRVLYLDADQVVFSDIRELFYWPMWQTHKVALVKNARGTFGKNKVPEKGKSQTSVMLMDLDKCDWDYEQLAKKVRKGVLAEECFVKTGKLSKNSYAALMQLAWMKDNEICELPPCWNDFNLVEPDTKLVHWSCVRDQPYRNPKHVTVKYFKRELRKAVDAGHITREELEYEIKKKHLHPSFRAI